MVMGIEINMISPRISFSHDLDHKPDRFDSTPDFDFCFPRSGPAQEPSPADELFSNGQILPIQIKNIPIPARQSRASNRPNPDKKKLLKDFLSSGDDEEKVDSENKNTSPARPFWRSSSMNSDNNLGAKNMIRSLHFLSRSNSTGSVPVRPVLQKQPSGSSRKSSSSSSSASSSHAYYPYRPALNKSGSHGNGAVLNLPPPYISRVTVNLFGFGSIFCNGKFKTKNKK